MTSPMPEPAHSSPKPKSPASKVSFARKISATLTTPLATHHDRPGDEDARAARASGARARSPRAGRASARARSARSLCSSAAGDPRDEQRRDARTSPRSPSTRGRARTPRRARRRASGPIAVVVHSTSWSSAFAVGELVARGRGSAGRRARPGRKNALPMPATAASSDDRRRASSRTAAATNTASRAEVGADHQPLAREPVDERPERAGRGRPPAGCSRSAARRPTSPDASGRRRRPGARSPPASSRCPDANVARKSSRKRLFAQRARRRRRSRAVSHRPREPRSSRRTQPHRRPCPSRTHDGRPRLLTDASPTARTPGGRARVTRSGHGRACRRAQRRRQDRRTRVRTVGRCQPPSIGSVDEASTSLSTQQARGTRSSSTARLALRRGGELRRARGRGRAPPRRTRSPRACRPRRGSRSARRSRAAGARSRPRGAARSNSARRVLADVDVDEVADGAGTGSRPCSRSARREPREPSALTRAPARDLGRVVEARERRDLRRASSRRTAAAPSPSPRRTSAGPTA